MPELRIDLNQLLGVRVLSFEAGREAVKVLRGPSSIWPVKTGRSKRAFRFTWDAGARRVTIINSVSYAVYVEGRMGQPARATLLRARDRILAKLAPPPEMRREAARLRRQLERQQHQPEAARRQRQVDRVRRRQSRGPAAVGLATLALLEIRRRREQERAEREAEAARLREEQRLARLRRRRANLIEEEIEDARSPTAGTR